MAVTYSFSANTRIQSAQVNTNFTDCLPVNWTTWTPTITVAGGTAPTYTTDYINRYCQIGKTVFVQMVWSNAAGGTAGNGAAVMYISLPVTAYNDASTYGRTLGYGSLYEAGTFNTIAKAVLYDTTTFFFMLAQVSGVNLVYYNVNGDAQSDAGRNIIVSGFYEAA